MGTRGARKRQEAAQRARGNAPQPRRERSPKPAELDNEPCPHGHPEQAQAFILYGTPPRKCPRCGETPNFGGAGLGCERCGGAVVTNIGSPCGCEMCASCEHIAHHDEYCVLNEEAEEA